jgi:hypothetical protein
MADETQTPGSSAQSSPKKVSWSDLSPDKIEAIRKIIGDDALQICERWPPVQPDPTKTPGR